MTQTPNPADLGELVARLRAVTTLPMICGQAADAIAALQAERDALMAENLAVRRQMIGLTEHGCAHQCRADKAEAEVAALKAKLERAAWALGPFAKEGRLIANMQIVGHAPGMLKVAFMAADVAYTELTQEP